MNKTTLLLAVCQFAFAARATFADWNGTIGASNPLNWYRFDETSGSTLKDWGSQHLNGTYGTGTANPIRDVQGLVGKGVQFIGNHEKAILGGSDLTGDWTAIPRRSRTSRSTSSACVTASASSSALAVPNGSSSWDSISA